MSTLRFVRLPRFGEVGRVGDDIFQKYFITSIVATILIYLFLFEEKSPTSDRKCYFRSKKGETRSAPQARFRPPTVGASYLQRDWYLCVTATTNSYF
jgi:hypothetical protein